jgi:hypothetical protein
MAIRKIELDEDANQILDSMAKVYGGDASLVISELLRAHETIESFLDELESSHGGIISSERARRAWLPRRPIPVVARR